VKNNLYCCYTEGDLGLRHRAGEPGEYNLCRARPFFLITDGLVVWGACMDHVIPLVTRLTVNMPDTVFWMHPIISDALIGVRWTEPPCSDRGVTPQHPWEVVSNDS